MRNYSLYLKDILEGITAIEKFVGDMSIDEFKKDDKTASAVVRKFEIIGEAAKQIPKETTRKYSDVPWKEMAGMRDKLIHFYFGINYEVVWDTIKKRLPHIKPLIQQALKNNHK